MAIITPTRDEAAVAIGAKRKIETWRGVDRCVALLMIKLLMLLTGIVWEAVVIAGVGGSRRRPARHAL